MAFSMIGFARSTLNTISRSSETQVSEPLMILRGPKSSLRNATLEAKARRLTLLSAHGRIKLKDGTSVNIGGSTGGFTRVVLYNWTKPDLMHEYQ